MTEKSTPVVLCTYMKATTFLGKNLSQQMVLLRVMVDFVREVRTGVENSYSRVAAWFPLLGNNKRKLNYSEHMLILAVQAAVRLHNFIMNTDNLSYAAYECI